MKARLETRLTVLKFLRTDPVAGTEVIDFIQIPIRCSLCSISLPNQVVRILHVENLGAHFAADKARTRQAAFLNETKNRRAVAPGDISQRDTPILFCDK